MNLRHLAAIAAAVAMWALSPSSALAQQQDIPPAEKLVRVTAPPVTIEAGARAHAVIAVDIAAGWHVNAHPASPDYMVATDVALRDRGGVTAGAPSYPPGRPIKLAFDESEISVYDGRITIDVPLTAAASAVNGTHALGGALRFQACNDQLCLAPARVQFTVLVAVRGGKAPAEGAASGGSDSLGAAEPDTGASSTAGASPPAGSVPPPQAPEPGRFSTGPPPAGAAATVSNPLANALDRGGFAAFLALFLIGLALNLTPCVYPMLGVTVSVFGARRATPPLQVFGLAVVYVLGMALMYSALGLVAAFTGGLFGGFLQNPLVLVAIGALLAAMALSMFGLYEIQLPAAIRERAGAVQATSVAGVFLSGLVVGVFAAPCVGPAVVALLAIVGAKGDPWFGFSSFFVLALGLGAPYLVLGTFSNLLQRLPRSGDWMEWVKHVFGVVLIALAAFYVLLGLAPALAVWVPPAALVLGGIYLGFIDRHADRRPAFRTAKRIGAAAAVIVGVAIVAAAPRQSIPLQPFSNEALQAALAAGQPVMVDFSADWCVPCHELERFTFTDRRVVAAARRFATFQADLTRYDSPEAEAWRKQYGISGVPTVLFLAPDGSEVREARVEGFLPAERFVERMEVASRSGQRAEERP